jgi:hypothetical protein
MFAILGVSQGVVVTLLKNWIGVKSLGRLDSAVCCATERIKLLSVLCSSALILDTASLHAANARSFTKFLGWMIRRKVKVSAWVFHLDVDPCLVIDLAECTGGRHVRTLIASDMKEETAAVLLAVVTTCKNINKITIKNTEHWSGLCVVREEAARALQELSVIDCGIKSSRLFKPGSLTRLQKLHLTGEYPECTVNSLIEASPVLTDLRLKKALVSDRGLQILARNAKRLETLVLSSCPLVSDSAVIALAPSCKNLRTWSFWECTQLTSPAMKAFAACCHKLECVQLSYRGGEGLATTTSSSGPTLVSLSLVGVTFAYDSILLAAVKNCHRLRELEVSSCTGITAECLEQLVSEVLLLQDLLLAFLNAVTDKVLIAITTHLPQLKSLNLYKSTGYTEDGAHALVRSLPRLRRFAVESTHVLFTNLVLRLWKDTQPELDTSEINRCTPGCAKLHTW